MGNPKRSPASLRDDPEPGNSQFVTALGRGMTILRCFDREASQLGNQEIAARTGLPKATVSRLTFTLASLGFLSYSAALEKYSLGVGVLALAHAYVRGNGIMAAARPLMQELADYMKAAVMLGAPHGRHMVLLEICQGDEIFNIKLEIGARVPHSSTALGRAHMAALSQDAFERELEMRRGECSAIAWPKIKTGIVRARQDYQQYGFCFSLGDWNPAIFAVGVPIISSDKSQILAFNCSGRVAVVTREQIAGNFGPRLVALRNKVLDLVQGRF